MTPTPPPPPRRRLARRVVVAAALLYLVAVVGLTVAVRQLGDDSAPVTLVLFGPRWVAALPLLVLLPLALLVRSRAATALSVAAGMVAGGPLAGLAVNPGLVFGDERPALIQLRVMTWNMGGTPAGPAFKQFLARAKPDVILFQEVGPRLDDGELLKGWTLALNGRVRAASRLPLRQLDVFPADRLGIVGAAARYALTTPDGEVTLVNVHLPTVRPGINAAIDSKFRALDPLRDAIRGRAVAARLVRDWVGGPSPHLIVAGDFNSPGEGRIYNENWADFGNAYSDAGTGWGTTKQTGWHGVRIDHVLYAPPWKCRTAWVGPAMGSDHRPLVADLVLEDW